MWEAIEPTRNQFNETYLDEVESLVNRLGQAGIYTLIDAHQDAISKATCGEGIPDYYANEVLAKNEIYGLGHHTDRILAWL